MKTRETTTIATDISRDGMGEDIKKILEEKLIFYTDSIRFSIKSIWKDDPGGALTVACAVNKILDAIDREADKEKLKRIAFSVEFES